MPRCPTLEYPLGCQRASVSFASVVSRPYDQTLLCRQQPPTGSFNLNLPSIMTTNFKIDYAASPKPSDSRHLSQSDPNAGGEIQLYEPDPNGRYKIDDASRILGLSRRLLVLCCKYGLVSTVVDPVEAGWCFDGRTLRLLRRIEALRTLCDGNLRAVRMVLELQDALDRLNAELRTLRR